MAMSNSLGVDANIGKTMALNLTGLVGDIASFYNISSEQANTAISSIYTGETESIKKLGIVLTEANLNAYAVSQGLKKTYNQMTQAEKVMLRYNYVMMASANIQGDFARTSGNWANQVRILKEQFSQLMSILGRGLIAVLNPVVKVMNNLLASLIAVANAMAKAFGGKGIESASGKVSSSVGDIADGAGDVSDGFDSANDSAKALAKTVAGFDELNILSSPKGQSGDMGLGGDITGSGEVIEGPEIESPAGKLSKYLQECKDIIDKWVGSIPKIQLNFDKEKAENDLKQIGVNILNTVMGWGTFVVSLAIEVANDADIGVLANSFLNLIESATGLASAITDSLVPAFRIFYKSSGLQKIVEWIGEKFAGGMDGLAIKLDEWAEWFNTHKEDIKDFADRLGQAVNPIAQLVEDIGDGAWAIFTGLLERMNTALYGIAESLLKMDVDKLRTLMLTLVGLGGAFGLAKGGAELFGVSLLKILKDPALAIESFYLLCHDIWLPALGAKFMEFGSLIKAPFIGIKNLIASLGTVFTPVLIAMQGAYSATVNAIGASGGVFTTIKGLVAGVGAGFKALWGILMAHPIGLIVAAITLVITSLVSLYNKSEEFRNLIKDIYENTIKPVCDGIKDTFTDLYKNHLKPLMDKIFKGDDSLVGQIKPIIQKLWDYFSTFIAWVSVNILPVFVTVFGSVLQTIGEVAIIIVDLISGVVDVFSGLIKFISGAFSGDWKKAWEGIKQIFKGVFDSLVTLAKAPLNLVIGLINGVLNGLVSGINGVIRIIKKLSFTVPEWVPGIGGEEFGFGFLKTFTAPQIPYLANGGVITEPTVAMMGEYSGAYQNPEIVTPQSLLQQVIENSNSSVVDALIQQTRQLLSALEDIDMNVSIGDEQIAQAAQRGNLSYKRRTGKPLFA